jgi:hypothetical protein
VSEAGRIASSAVVVGLVLEAAGCAPSTVTPPAIVVPSVTEVPPAVAAPAASAGRSAESAPPSPLAPSAEEVALARLAPYAIDDDRFARRTLYSWTTSEQVAALRRRPALLTRTESCTFGRSFYQQVIDARAARGDTVAQLLAGPAFTRLRFAWPSAWPTVVAPDASPAPSGAVPTAAAGDLPYGDQLLRVELRDMAVVARFDSRRGWAFADVEGHAIPPAEALARPERIAAVYFVNHGDVADAEGRVREPYREYVLVNESQIARWSIGGDEARAEIAASIDALEAVRRAIEVPAGDGPPPQASSRSSKPPLSALKSAYEAALAFRAKEDLALSQVALSRLRHAESALPTPLQHEPTAAFVWRPKEVTVRPCPKPAAVAGARPKTGTY